MASLSEINIKFSADLKGFSSEMQNALRQLDKVGKQMTNIGKSLSTYVTAPLLLAGGASIKMASDFNESLNKVDVAFKSASIGIKEFAKTSLESFGIAEGSALDMAALFGDMATSMGLPVGKAAIMSKSLVGLAGDLASFKNIGIDQAVTALNGVFTGETESLKRIGVVMTEANLAAYALSRGIKTQLKDMSQAEKVNLRFAYVMEQTKNAQGDFARTSGGAANQTRIFQESLKQVGAQIGAVILPLFTKVISAINEKIKAFSNLSEGTKTLIVVIGGLAAAVGPVLLAIGTVLQILPVAAAGFTAVKTAVTSLTATMAANPFTVAAIAIAAVAAGLYLWYSNSEKVVTSQQALNDAIAAGEKAAGAEVAMLDTLFAAANNVKGSVDERKNALQQLQDLYPSYFKNLDLEAFKNGTAAAAYDKVREAIFNKARAVAIDSELQKRATERIEKELELRGEIERTENEIARLRKLSGDVVIQEGSAGEKTLRVTASKNDLLRAQNRLLAIQKGDLDAFTKKALEDDRLLLSSKQEYNEKSAQLQQDESGRMKELGLDIKNQADAADKLKANTIAAFEAQISSLQKLQKEIPTTNAAWRVYEDQIGEIQEKIDALTGKTITLPKYELPEMDVSAPKAFSLSDLKDELSYLEDLRNKTATTAAEYESYAEQINNVQIKIRAIEGVEDFKTSMEEVKTNVVEFGSILSSEMERFQEEAVVAFASLMAGIVTGSAGAADIFKGLLSLVGDFLVNLGKALIQTGIAAQAFKMAISNPLLAIGIGAALVMYGQIFKNIMKAGPGGGGSTAFANGGIVYGPVNALVGEYSGARSNPEVIAPLNKLKGMLGDTSSVVSVTVGGSFEIEGQKLRLVLDRTDTRNTRLGYGN